MGVIRALHSGGILEKAFCTETRPFNQVDIPSFAEELLIWLPVCSKMWILIKIFTSLAYFYLFI